MISDLIRDLLAGLPLDPARLEDALHAIMRGEVDPIPTAGLLIALNTRPPEGPTLAAAARVLRSHRAAMHPQVRPLVDTCGTGGDGSGTFNISTGAAMVLAACGAAVAKHGNRGVSSRVGSADVMAELGGRLDLDPRAACDVLDACGFVFLFAPVFHPAMAQVAAVRRGLGVRTIFNLLGPLANPALAEYQLLGVYDPTLTEVLCRALHELGSKGALVVHCDGLDEIGLHAATEGHRLRDGRIEPFRLDPQDHGIARQPIAALAGGEASDNAAILRSVLAGESGPCSDVVALNAAAAATISGLAQDFGDGLELARARLADGSAAGVLERYVESSQRRGERAVG